MKNLEIYLNDGTKVFECIISNHLGIIKIHHNCKMLSLKTLLESVINGRYKIEFENRVLDTSLLETIFDRIELFKNEENFNVIFDVVTSNKVLEYVYKNNIPYMKNIHDITNFFSIEVNKVDNINGIGEALLYQNRLNINYKEQIYKYREDFTIAHELGHIFLHFSTDKSVHFQDFDKDLQVVNNNNYRPLLKASRNNVVFSNKILEDEANIFARNLLVPKFQLEDFINSFMKKNNTKPYMSHLKNDFSVAKGTMFYALENAGLLNKVIDDCKPWINN